MFLLQFRFRQKYLTTHALLNLPYKITHKIDKGNFACVIFKDFNKAFEKVYYHILLKN